MTIITTKKRVADRIINSASTKEIEANAVFEKSRRMIKQSVEKKLKVVSSIKW